MRHKPEAARAATEHAGAASREDRRQPTEAGLTGAADRFIGMQGRLGNRNVARMLAGALRGGAPIQRMMQPEEDATAEEKKEQGGLKAVYEKKLKTAFDGPKMYHELMLEAGENLEAQAALLEANAVMEAEVEKLRSDVKILYGEPPLDANRGLALLEKIEQDDPNAFQTMKRNGASFNEEDARGHEWGLGRSRDKNGEVFLLCGSMDSVDWSPYLHVLAPLAHSHPYFESGRPRRLGQMNLATKEIADHPSTDNIKGIVRWDDLASKSSGDMSFEVAKIFPSAPDIAFCAEKDVPKHVVYTLYFVLENEKYGVFLANPFKLKDAPRLYFEIIDAKPADATGENFACTMKAHGGRGSYGRRPLRPRAKSSSVHCTGIKIHASPVGS